MEILREAQEWPEHTEAEQDEVLEMMLDHLTEHDGELIECPLRAAIAALDVYPDLLAAAKRMSDTLRSEGHAESVWRIDLQLPIR